jgi:uncharacterized protein YggU (UPF0235/DUF167 family)
VSWGVSARPGSCAWPRLRERGAANEAVVELVATTLGLHPRAVRLVSGFASRDKIVEVDGHRPDEAEARLASAKRKDA